LSIATRAIENKLGLIIAAAPVYEVEAVGFAGGDFLNTVILVHSTKTANETLEILHSIEKEMGRQPRKSTDYEDRIIDLDIIFYDSEVMETTSLNIPHQQAHKRNFVMQPLAAITPDFVHPSFGKSCKELMLNLEALTSKVDFEITLSRKRFPLNKLPFIAIEGNIGSGKTSLTSKITADFNAKPVLERFADNPFLPLFYEEPDRYAFPLEMSFLADRYQQLSDDVAQQDLFTDFIIADYYVVKSLIFSKITLDTEEYALYKRLFDMMYKELVKPDLYVYLYQTEERLLENIKKRGRDYEQNIESQYLSQIQQGYTEFIRSQQDLKIKVIDVTDLDFVNNHADYLTVLEQITAAIA
jgi:2-amino-4-hydroxy-6-hydroxymethyldihydropteridine diphosphokinase